MLKKYSTFLLVAIIITAITLQSCKNKVEKENTIAVSIIPIKYFVDRIVGDKWEVFSVIPPNANHTTYEPVPSDLKKVAKAKIFFESGNMGFEDAWIERFKSISADCQFVDISDNIQKMGGHYHDGEYHGADPHYWLSPSDAAIIADNIAYTMIQIDPDNSEFYQDNYQKLKADIAVVADSLYKMLKPISGSAFLIYHPSLTYFAHDFSLQQIAIEEHGKEPSAAYMAQIIDIAKEKNIKTIFYQSQYSGQSVENIAKEIGATTICFDPLAYNWDTNLLEIGVLLIENE
ncbi:MAG: zinc ABC transporter substrate-binding protein [Bacteroidales bacterium]|jgi:zinc transport system substrate-binding protein|nr:zinc ABC transporter substrate-binding protein [Bacteroidales bacterium]MDD2204489.1 zinc ABC transporter substrate-binding protein [Bacteroidales bacterium]MDD3152774.1 zinc ABC transporter substrate-binding protein [Bacteroidales bacterium]MDD3914603.1 zinc ABC transporter substrate-binding protein [Bacteroidales bacterium]MDD4633828.1 zinc ABC transporter substrate-binding protein [Bacteroidales bacterium]